MCDRLKIPEPGTVKLQSKTIRLRLGFLPCSVGPARRSIRQHPSAYVGVRATTYHTAESALLRAVGCSHSLIPFLAGFLGFSHSLGRSLYRLGQLDLPELGLPLATLLLPLLTLLLLSLTQNVKSSLEHGQAALKQACRAAAR